MTSVRGFRNGQTGTGFDAIGGRPPKAGFDRRPVVKGIGFDHKEISKDIRTGLRSANKSLDTAERFGNKTFYNQGEARLRQARANIQSVGQYKVSRKAALRHAIGFDKRGAYMVTVKAGGPREIMMTGLTRQQALIHAKNARKMGYLSARTEKAHPPGCNCPFHGGHAGRKGGIGYNMKGIGTF